MACHPQRFPRIPSVRIISSAWFLDCFRLVYKTVSRPFPFCVSCGSNRARHLRNLVWQAFQLHLPERSPKTYFLEPIPLAPPWGLSVRPVLEALKVFVFKGKSGWTQRSGISRVSGWYHPHVGVTDTVSIRLGNREHIVKNKGATSFETLLHFHASEKLSSLTLSEGSKQGHSPKPHPFISSSSFQSLSSDLYKTTPTALSKHVPGVCSPSNGSVNVISTAMFTASWSFAIFVPSFVIFDCVAQARRTTTVLPGLTWHIEVTLQCLQDFILLQENIEFRYPLMFQQGILAKPNGHIP